jgi:hypothetical protein
VVLGEKKPGEDESRKGGLVEEMLTRERAKCDKCGEEYDVSEGHKCRGE